MRRETWSVEEEKEAKRLFRRMAAIRRMARQVEEELERETADRPESTLSGCFDDGENPGRMNEPGSAAICDSGPARPVSGRFPD